MQGYLDANDLYAHILMLRTVDLRNILLVEGNSDCGLLDPFLDSAECHSLPANGKSTVEGAISIADAQGTEGVLAILDRDWVGMLSTPIESGNAVYTEAYDLDAEMALLDTILDRVTSNFCDRQAMKQHLDRIGSPSVRDLAVTLSAPLGILRFVSERDSLNLSLRNFPLREIMTDNYSSIDLPRLISIAVARTEHRSFDEGSLVGAVRKELSEKARALWLYCSGHDIAACLAVLVRRCWGGEIGADNMERAIRAAVSREDFRAAAIFKSTERWADRTSRIVFAT